jgi:hypothetical protein
MISVGNTDQFGYNVFITKFSPGSICQKNSTLVKIGQKIGSICQKNSTSVEIGQKLGAFVKKIRLWLKPGKNLERLSRKFDFG